MSTTNDSSSTDAQSDDNDDSPIWSFESHGMALTKQSYSTYELSFDSTTIEFNEVRANDDGTFELRDRDRNTLANFDPSAESVPVRIETGFTVLADEL